MSLIALVTVTYNGEAVWSDFVESLKAQTSTDWMLVVVDNASTDGTKALLRAEHDSRLHIIDNNKNLGVATANNQGITYARSMGAKWIIIINNDTVFGPELVSRLLQTAESERADAVSPLIPYHEAPDRVWYGGGRFERARGFLMLHEHFGKPLSAVGKIPFTTDYAPTCCLMVAAHVFDKIGLMDDRYFVYWDDVDYLWRMKLAGMKIILQPNVLLYHKVSSSTGGRLTDFSIRYSHRNQIFFCRKFFGRPFVVYTAIWAIGVGVVRVFVSGDTVRHAWLRLLAVREGWSRPL